MALDTAKRLAKRGVNLILVARGKEGLGHAKSAIRQEGDVQVDTHSVDLYSADAVNQLIAQLEKEQRHITYLVNAAGYFKPTLFLEHSRDDYHAQLDLNEAVFFITQAVAKNMKTHGGGTIVNIGSMWANSL